MKKRDPYYRNFLSNTLPIRTPFSRSGIKDRGHYFIYMTNSRKWTLLLDRHKFEEIGDEAQKLIPMGYNQLWLFKKIYSTKRFPKKQSVGKSIADYSFHNNYPSDLERKYWPNRLYVVLREPYTFSTIDGDVLSYCIKESDAIHEANIYTLQKNRRSVVGLMVWDLQWH